MSANTKKLPNHQFFIQYYVLRLGNDFYHSRGGGILTSAFTQAKSFADVEDALEYRKIFDEMHGDQASVVLDVGAIARPALIQG